MSFKLGDKIYKEILYFYAEDKGTICTNSIK